MEAGIKDHAKFERETKKTGKTPKVFKTPIEVTATELKHELRLNPWLKIVGQADALTNDRVVDYKTTSSDTKTASDFMRYAKPQLQIYCYLFGVNVGEIWCYNRNTKKTTRSARSFSNAEINACIADVEAVAIEIKQELQKNNTRWWREPAEKIAPAEN